MSDLKHAGSFRDLIVYQKSRQLQRNVRKVSMSFPRDEQFSLTSQIRRSSRSIGANIAESWAKRRYEKHFISKLTDADGEQMEPSIGSRPRWRIITLTRKRARNS
jgi:hypothetical protein